MPYFLKLSLFSLVLLLAGCSQPKTESIQPVPVPTELIRSEGFSTLGPSTNYDLTDVYQRYPYLSGPSYIDEAAVYFYASSEKRQFDFPLLADGSAPEKTLFNEPNHL